MRLRVIIALWLLSTFGCQGAQEAQREAREAQRELLEETEQNNQQPIDLALPPEGTAEPQSKTEFGRQITTATEYYTTGPQQGRAPDGMFLEGTRIRILEEAGSYALVESEDGITAYVSVGAIDGSTEASGLR